MGLMTKGGKMKNKICMDCGHIGQPTTQGVGSFFVDLMIWMVISSFTLFTAFLPLMLIPIGWTIYHFITYKTITCPNCENLEMVSLTSRRGKQALASRQGKHTTKSLHTHNGLAN